MKKIFFTKLTNVEKCLKNVIACYLIYIIGKLMSIDDRAWKHLFLVFKNSAWNINIYSCCYFVQYIYIYVSTNIEKYATSKFYPASDFCKQFLNSSIYLENVIRRLFDINWKFYMRNLVRSGLFMWKCMIFLNFIVILTRCTVRLVLVLPLYSVL